MVSPRKKSNSRISWMLPWVWEAVKFSPLTLLVYAALRLQMTWEQDRTGGKSVLMMLWGGLFLCWTCRLILMISRKQKLGLRQLVLPIAALLVFLLQLTTWPIRVLFLLQRPALENALPGPILSRAKARKAARIGWFQPLQVAHSKETGGVRFLFFVHSNTAFLNGRLQITSGAVVGYVHCDDASLIDDFEPYWKLKESGGLDVLPMGRGWYVVRIYGGDDYDD